MDSNKILESVSKKLGVLIALNLHSMNSKATATDNIKMLDRFGLTPTEIAEILNTTPNHVNVTRSIIKKNSAKKK
jgi:DNA-binding CsgD family transcriptional regulator